MKRIFCEMWLWIALLGLGPLAGFSQGSTSDFAYRNALVIQGDEVVGTHTDFPILVRISGTDFTTYLEGNARSDGYDIAFSDANGNWLDFELQEYDETNDVLLAWVKTTLSGSDQTIYMYYGNSSITSDLSSATTWSNSFQAVWHLENANPTDATNNGNDGTDVNGLSSVTGQIGLARSLEGDDDGNQSGTDYDYIDINTQSNIEITSNPITLSAWVRLPSGGVDDDEGVVVRAQPGSNNSERYMLGVADKNGNTDYIDFRIRQNGLRRIEAGDIPEETWTYIVGTTDGTTMRAYIDASQVGTRNTGDAPGNSGTDDVRLGWRGDNDVYEGYMDEVRIATATRSADWISTEFNNQSQPDSFLVVGTQEDRCLFAYTYSLSSSSVSSGQPVTLTINGLGAGINVQWQSSLDNVTFSNISGATDTTYTSGSLTQDIYFRAQFSGACTNTTESRIVTVASFIGDYSYRKPLQINVSQVGGSSDLTDFPVWVVIDNDLDLRDTTNGGHVSSSLGYDLIFSDQSGNQLSHELTSYNASTGSLTAWVRIPTLSASSNTQFYLNYGNCDGALTNPSTTATWDPVYLAVWHMDNDPSGSAPQIIDATSQNNDGTSQGSMTSSDEVSALLGNGLDLDGSDDYILAGGLNNAPSSLQVTDNTISLSGWIQYQGQTGSQYSIIEKSDGYNAVTDTKYWLGLNGNDLEIRLTTANGGNRHNVQTNLVSGSYYHLALTYDGSVLIGYLNAQAEITEAVTGNLVHDAGDEVLLGKRNNNRFWDGILDELRISHQALSAGWIQTEYNNQLNPASFITVGSEEGQLYWTGAAGDGDWYTLSNWSICRVPGTTETARIASGGTAPNLTSDVTIGNLIIESGATLTVASGADLTVSGYISNAGTITVQNEGALIQTAADDNNGNSGTYNIHRSGDNADNRFNGWSSPIVNASLHASGGVFGNVNPCDLYVFDAASQTYKYDYSTNYSATCNGNPVTFTSQFLLPSADGLMDAGRGYFVPGEASSQRNFSGSAVHNGTITHSLGTGTNPGGVNWTGDYWNFLGNPYPSALQVSAFLSANSSLLTSAAVYVWSDDGTTGSGYNQTDYITLNSLGSVGPVNGNDITNGNIASCQGFFVQGTVSGGNITFTNAMRSSGNDQFRKRSASNGCWLRLTHEQSISRTLIGLTPQATTGFDPEYDAPRFYGQYDLNVSTLLPDSAHMVIQGIPPVPMNEVWKIPLALESVNTGMHVLEIDSLYEWPGNQGIYLWDATLEKKQDLRHGPYPFFFDASTDTYRFELWFTNEVTSAPIDPVPGPDDTLTHREEIHAINSLEVANLGSEIVLTWQQPVGEQTEVLLVDVRGSLLYRSSAATGDLSHRIPTGSLQTGVYFIRVQTQSGRSTHRKIYVQPR